MKEDNKNSEDAKKDAEDVLNFDDGLAREEREEESDEISALKEIIDLVDVIENGEVVKDSESDEITERAKEDWVFEEQGAIEEGLDLSSEELMLSPNGEATQRLEADIDSMLEGLESSERDDITLEISDRELEAALDAELSQRAVRGLEGSQEVEKSIETGEATPPHTPPESPPGDLSEAQGTPGEQLEAEKLIGISEERLEAIVTRVIEDVMERVARETMTNVTERLVKEAIDALKKSLEPSHE